MRIASAALLMFALRGSAQTGATVEGTVSDSVTHVPVAGVSVTLWTQKGTRYTAQTDSSGVFRVEGAQPGEYDSRFEKAGYVQLELPRFGESRLRVGGAGSFHLDAQLSAMGTLRGRVLDPEGRPAAKVMVSLGPFVSDETDEEGRFELKDLRPGTYTMLARTQETQTGPVQIVPTWYPSTINQAEAERITVRGGADLAGYEIRLRTSPVYRVRGVVLDEVGKPAADASVTLFGRGESRLLMGRIARAGEMFLMNLRNTAQGEPMALSGKDGTFEFPAVQPGDWSVEASLHPLDSNNNLYIVGSDPVPAPVSDHDVENVELRFLPSFSVTVTADWGDQQPPANARPDVMLMTAGGGMRLAGFAARPAPDGSVVFDHFQSGRYQIMPTPGHPAGFYAAAVMLGGANVLGQEIELTAGMPPIRVVYRPNPGRIRGTVAQGEGAVVLLWPDGPEIPEVVRSVQGGANGGFEFANVAPGDYSLVAFDRIPPAGGSEAFVRGAIAAGTRVKLQEGGSESVEVSLTHWLD
ncbi:MAG: carboxypeptidase regulatory-like domain-containing protein [Acidobacteriia bacterium]|nr:carboxypeptidase regulatory-like domain-containing protein [Terriglobia bacterium]